MTLQRQWRKRATLVAFFVYVGAPVADAQFDGEAAQIVEAWRRREQHVVGFHCEWKETVAVGKIPDPPPIPEAASEAERLQAIQQFRAARVGTFDKQVSLTINRNRVRFEEDGSIVSMDATEKLPYRRVAVFDGTVSKSHKPHSDSPFPRGQISGEDKSRGLEYIGALPLRFLYRPSIALDELTRISSAFQVIHARIESVPCALLRQTSGLLRYDVATDLAEPHLVRRIVCRSQSGKVRFQIDIKYADNAVPSEWTLTRWNADGSPQYTTKHTVIRFQLNPQVSDDVFDIQFPVSTYVVDDVGSQHFIQRTGGQKRLITETEKHLPYEDLLSSETGELTRLRGDRDSISRLRWIVIGASLCAIIWVGVAVRQLRRR